MSPQVTAYGGELRYTVTHRAPAGAPPFPRHPDVLLQGNGILLEHFSSATPPAGVPTAVTVPIREVRAVPVWHPAGGAVEGGGQTGCWGGVGLGTPGVRLGAGEVTLGAPGAGLGAVGDGGPHITPVWHRAPGAAQTGVMPPVSTS